MFHAIFDCAMPTISDKMFSQMFDIFVGTRVLKECNFTSRF